MMKNPYKFLREKAGFTQKRFCDEYEFAKQTIIMIEHGVYPELSDRMIDSLNKACFHAGFDPRHELEHEYGYLTLEQAYDAWKHAERKKVPAAMLDEKPEDGIEDVSPMAILVKETDGSVQGFAKTIKIPSATLLRYVRGDQKFMPASIREALTECGYRYVSELEEKQAKWVDTYAGL